jgi:hypothetical protein
MIVHTGSLFNDSQYLVQINIVVLYISYTYIKRHVNLYSLPDNSQT